MSRILSVKVGPLASASANNIATSQTATGTVTLNGSLVTGGVAVLDTPRHVIFTPGGDDTLLTYTATGTDFAGYPLVVSAAGTNSTAVDFGVSFATITKIAITVTSTGASGTSHSGLTVGTNTVADSAPIFLDQFGFAPTSLQAVVSGTVNYTVNQTLDNPTDPNWLQGTGGTPKAFGNVTWFNHPDSTLVGATGSVQGNYAYVPFMTRVTLNSGSGLVIYSVIQAASPSI